MKQIITTAVFLMAFAHISMAQTPAYKKCCGTKSTQFPFKNITARKTQLWYNPGDFTSPSPVSGMITRIYFVSQAAGQSGTYDDLTVLFKQPAASNMGFTGTTFETGMTQVYYAKTVTLNGASTAGGWYWIDLTTPFTYDHTKPLVVEVNYSNPTTIAGGGLDNWGTDATVPPNKKLYAATIAATTGTTSNGFWQDFGFDVGSPCTSPAGLVVSNLKSNSATVSWGSVPASAGYEYVVIPSATPPTSGIATLNVSEPVTGLTPASNYYLHVRNKCAGNVFSSWTSLAFSTPAIYCVKPTSIFFSNITKTSADVLWTQMPTADRYEYAMDITRYLQPTSANAKTTTTNSASLKSLVPNTWHYLWVRAICLNGSDSSDWKLDSFITKSECLQPQVTINNPGNTPTATWQPVPDAVAYEWVVKDDIVTPAFGTEIKNTSLNLVLPEDNREKFLHLRTKCLSQFSFSEWTTTPLRVFTSSVSSADLAGLIRAYPNPVTHTLVLEITNAKPGESLKLTDMVGRVIKELKTEGISTLIGMRDVASGIYLVQYAGATGNASIRITKQ